MTMSLREKKRELLKATIERSAVDLVLEHGYNNVTVDMICEASLASQRTFFNYFGSKEAVILGPPPPAPDPSLIDEFVHHRDGDVLSDLARMMTRILGERGDVDLQLWRDRREIIRQDPDLMRSQAERIAAKDTELTEIVKRRLRARRAAGDDAVTGDQPDADADAASRDDDRQARLIVNLWWGIARYAMKLWAEEPDQTPQQITDDLLTVLARIKEA
ncbi:TetR/AcrR family transcriptional regulator [Microlunatus soli]|uniref:Regulatory protein, tetR family n=1 Tax=Microlunatus soli TaxID=630515 RepID=A0A1H1S6T1_9ACTN|nr:TetR/AcrR family transcriptional regulator [Microlunatus soli]SDS43800.1 regulatory protein, tetR family [Microlunatus soli]